MRLRVEAGSRIAIQKTAALSRGRRLSRKQSAQTHPLTGWQPKQPSSFWVRFTGSFRLEDLFQGPQNLRNPPLTSHKEIWTRHQYSAWLRPHLQGCDAHRAGSGRINP